MEADINFRIEDYEEDLKQVKGERERERRERLCLFCRDFILSTIVLPNLILYSCVFDILFFSLCCYRETMKKKPDSYHHVILQGQDSCV